MASPACDVLGRPELQLKQLTRQGNRNRASWADNSGQLRTGEGRLLTKKPFTRIWLARIQCHGHTPWEARNRKRRRRLHQHRRSTAHSSRERRTGKHLWRVRSCPRTSKAWSISKTPTRTSGRRSTTASMSGTVMANPTSNSLANAFVLLVLQNQPIRTSVTPRMQLERVQSSSPPTAMSPIPLTSASLSAQSRTRIWSREHMLFHGHI